ncbi:MAG: AAA family ATPase, partial [Gammaproteobacteria bacterium]|nr:AAA family ATPase [Gammaproteobacteria bacterium]NIO24098.1 AAA family ATPase [Gammaproteobacteria bacterium]NIO64748.1 AAA family ATPase [Gammaproteobacteria bacterium]NIP63521.1 AAA family ATPase [Gammaproteobacteria bacterium]NIQ25927.1 AAA family ATPase [Gammaproteobacteria bacterium]
RAETRAEAERRQLTVMFCDLVGSTELARRLDPEDLRDVMRAFQDRCAGVISRFDGFIARYMGDGLLVYFGFPRAHEDDAERAVRSGLDIVASIGALNAETGASRGVHLAVRVGIATGRVVVGDIVGEGASAESAVVGDTPNLAARLQSVAAADQVVIGAGTRALLGDRFDCEDLGGQSLKGIDEPVPAWRVTGERGEAAGRAARAAGAQPLVGRQEELGLLLRAWDTAREGLGQVVLVLGEPGIGKSRLVEALVERIDVQDHLRVPIRCSPYHTQSALYPVVEHLKRAFGWRGEDGADERLAKLEAALQGYSVPLAETVPLYA